MAISRGRPEGNKFRQAADYAAAGAAALDAGDLGGALTGYFKALVLAPNNPIYLHTAVSLIGVSEGYALPPIIRAILGDAAKAPAFNCQALSTAVHGILAHDPLGREFLGVVAAGGDALEAALQGPRFDTILEDKLIRAVLRWATILSPDVEAMVTGLRRHALDRVAASKPTCLTTGRLDLLVSIAAQCFNSEYAFDVSEAEQAALDRILSEGAPKEDRLWALIGAYRPLLDVIGHAKKPVVPKGSAISFLFSQQIDEPRRERALRREIPAFTPIAADLSARMQSQYEHFPYPRWFGVQYARPRSFKDVIEERFPDVVFADLPRHEVSVLVPGCGTGHQVAQVAGLFKRVRITAVDLSLTSLAYARRKLDELGIRVHRLGQADILAMGGWDERYDFIECMGVLHHLKRPEQGLAVLTGLMKPNGIVRLGLYSERVRRQLDPARQFVRDRGLPDSPDGVRAARRLIAALPGGDPIRQPVGSQDFYSISGLHDLIFNVHERSYTPLGLKTLLDQVGLELLGFDHLDPGVTVRYRERFPADKAQTDLANWDAFEREFPDTFASMYLFWCRRAERS